MNIYNIEVRHLRYFLAVAKELNFSRAAEVLHISQPPLSQQIQELEARIETPLFSRTKRKVELTKAGQFLLPIAHKITREFEEALHATRSVGHGYKGEIRIGTIFSAPLSPSFSRVIKSFSEKHPKVRLSFREMRHTHLLQALLKKEIDVSFSWHIAPIANKQICSRIISSEKMSFYVAKDHALARHLSLNIAEIVEETFFMTSLQTKMAFFPKLLQLAQKDNVSLRISAETLHFPVIANLIAAGGGIGVLPSYVAHLATCKLVARDLRGIKDQDMILSLALLYRNGDTNPLLADLLSSLS